MIPPERYALNTSSFAHYWTKGKGRHLLDRLGYSPDISNADRYVPYLWEYDAAADAVVSSVHQSHGFLKGQQLVESVIRGITPGGDTETDPIRTFLSEIDAEPSWLDRDLLRYGQEFCQRSSLAGLIVLRDYCLMGGYESAAINKPLVYTGALKKGAAKRISETVDFWVEITGDPDIRYGSKGFISIIKTRMIHSFSRVNILKSTSWDSSKWGVPLNAWDMLATNLGFSLVFLTGLRQMGLQPLQEEVSGLLHFWKYVGYLLGIPLHLLPDTEPQAIEALYYWTMTQPEGDEDTRALALALQEEPISSHFPPTKIGRYMMREIHLYYNRFLLGDFSCNMLGLEHTRIGALAYINILKTRMESRRPENSFRRAAMISKGRRVHEEVRDIYRQRLKNNHSVTR